MAFLFSGYYVCARFYEGSEPWIDWTHSPDFDFNYYSCFAHSNCARAYSSGSPPAGRRPAGFATLCGPLAAWQAAGIAAGLRAKCTAKHPGEASGEASGEPAGGPAGWSALFGRRKSPHNELKRLRKATRRLLRAYRAESAYSFAEMLGPGTLAKPPEGGLIDEALLEELSRLIAGRVLSAGDIRKLLRHGNLRIPASRLDDYLRALVIRGDAAQSPGIIADGSTDFRCARCGSRELYEAVCAACGSDHCLRCAECGQMGEVRSCDVLYFGLWPEGSKSSSYSPCSLPEPSSTPDRLNLTPVQARAAAELQDFVLRRWGECLLWAVCGAGKTEMVIPAIETALGAGMRVLYASPRREVVIELGRRLRSLMGCGYPSGGEGGADGTDRMDGTDGLDGTDGEGGGIRTAVLYGGSPDLLDPEVSTVPLVVATTHQVLRFNGCFDLVILDEVDAFPYRDSRMLKDGVQRAKARDGKLVYLTATPDRTLRFRAKSGEIGCIIVPVRHHGNPVPEPQIIKARLPPLRQASDIVRQGPDLPRQGSNMTMPRKVLDAFEECLEAGARVFAFVPTTAAVEPVASCLRKNLEGRVVAGVSSRSPERDSTKTRFMSGDIDVLVTTTLMERGVTVANANVIVLYADFERVFDESTLIQMVGRAGRSREYPDGRCIFVAATISSSMKRACSSIREMNLMAAAAGLLKLEGEFVPKS